MEAIASRLEAIATRSKKLLSSTYETSTAKKTLRGTKHQAQRSAPQFLYWALDPPACHPMFSLPAASQRPAPQLRRSSTGHRRSSNPVRRFADTSGANGQHLFRRDPRRSTTSTTTKQHSYLGACCTGVRRGRELPLVQFKS